MTRLKIRPVGTSLGLELPEDVLSALNLSEGDEIVLSRQADGSLRLVAEASPDPADASAQMEAALEGMDRYRSTLRDLAR